MNAVETFKSKSPWLVSSLMRDFGVKDFQAGGVAGNTGRECLGFTALREIGQPPGRGGYGWQQWTGPRARSFLNWCSSRHLDWRSDAANYGYLRYELQNDYAYVIAHLHETATVEEATEVFERMYERAGVPAMADRIYWAKMALDAYRASVPKAASPTAAALARGAA